MTAQLLQIIDLGAHGRLANQPHHNARTARVVDRACLALRARIARGERRVRHLDLFGAHVVIGPVAAVASGWHLGIALGLDGNARCQCGCGITFRVRRRARLETRRYGNRRLILVGGQRAADHCRSLLRLHAKEHLPQAADRRVLVADRLSQADVRLDQGADRLEIVRLQVLRIDAAKNLFQFAHVQLDDPCCGMDHGGGTAKE